MKSGFVIAALQSGSGKTTVSLSLMALLHKQGFVVQPFKIGPDFIDPGLHRVITGRGSWNLDPWMCGAEYVRNIFQAKSSDADVAVVEGVMGVFDGGVSSTAEVAKLLGLPIVLVLDVKSMAESAASIVMGIQSYDKDIRLAGVILNRIGSPKHLELVQNAINKKTDIKIIGHIPTDISLKIPERHLGLFTADDEVISEEIIQKLADTAKSFIDLDTLLQLTTCKSVKIVNTQKEVRTGSTKLRLGVARDKAFCFYYEDNLEMLREYGVETVFFSPLEDRVLPPELTGLYIGGGYPELYARRLAENQEMLASIRKFIMEGGITYAECGGFMYLTEGIYDFEGKFHPMAGIYPVRARMKRGRVSLGYREVVLKENTIVGSKGDRIRGHEFHYSETEEMPQTVKDVYGIGGYVKNNCLASYIHLHFASNPNIAKTLARKMRQQLISSPA